MTAIEAAARRQSARARVRELMPLEADLGFRRRCETILEWLDPSPGETVLDCGCGYGFTLRMLAELTPAALIGLDLQHERLTDARAKLPSAIRWIQGSAQELPIANDSLPKVVCSEVLEHLPNDREAVSELFRVLKPGGTLVVTVPAARYPAGWDPVNWLLERTLKTHIHGERMFSGIWYGHRRLYTRASLESLMSDAGFQIEETRGLTHYVPPFSHLIVYGIMKPLLVRGIVPRSLAKANDRCGEPKPLTGLPAKLAGWLNRIDAKNDHPDLEFSVESFVALGIRVRKP